MGWDPHAPGQLGQAWFATKAPSTPLDGEYVAAAAVLDSTGAETISSVWVYAANVGSASPLLDGWELEIYDSLNMVGGAVSTTIYRPSADAFNNDMFGYDGAVSVSPPLFDLINESTNVPGTGPESVTTWDQDFINPIFGTAAEATFHFGSIVGTLDNRHLLAVTLRGYAQELIAIAHVSGVTITPYLRRRGIRYLGDPVSFTGQSEDYYLVEHTWFACPWTGASWKTVDVEEFDDTEAEAEAGWIIAATGTANNLALIYRGELEVTWGATDPREAVGTLRAPRRGWNEIPLLDKATGVAANWSKTARRYLLVLRRRTGTGFVWWRYLDSGEPMPHVWSRGRPPVDANQRLVNLLDGGLIPLGDLDQDGGYAILLERTSGAVISADSQPYAEINDDLIEEDGVFGYWTRVHATQTLQQELTPAATATFGWLRILAAAESVDTTADLTVTLRRRSDNVSVGARTFTVADDLTGVVTRFQELEGVLTPAPALTSGVQYYAEFTCPATQGSGWRVQVLSPLLVTNPGGPPTGVDNGGYGGGTDRLTVAAVEHTELDAAVTIHTQPSAPAGFAATAAGEQDCIDWIDLTWTATALGADFLRYEIERSDDAGATWHPIHYEGTEAVTALEDHESLLNTAAVYRIRVRRRDRSASNWSATATATATQACCGYVFSSNQEPTLTVWYDDLRPRIYTFEERVEEQEMYGRFGAVAFRETEDRGDTLNITLLVAADGGHGGTVAANPVGRRVFDPLLILAGNKIDPDTGAKVLVPYVCVRDSNGNRWFASVRTPRGIRAEPEAQYTLEIVVREVADHPSPARTDNDTGS